MRNHLLIVVGLNTALRISDILNLKWSDIYDFKRKKIKQYMGIREKKTGKSVNIYINNNISELALGFINAECKRTCVDEDSYIIAIGKV